jgi:hypothetical protein
MMVWAANSVVNGAARDRDIDVLLHGTWMQLFSRRRPADRLIEDCDAKYREAGGRCWVGGEKVVGARHDGGWPVWTQSEV